MLLYVWFMERKKKGKEIKSVEKALKNCIELKRKIGKRGNTKKLKEKQKHSCEKGYNIKKYKKIRKIQ